MACGSCTVDTRVACLWCLVSINNEADTVITAGGEPDGPLIGLAARALSAGR